MPLPMSRYSLAVLVLACPLFAADPPVSVRDKDWSVVAGGPEGTRFSALRQINRKNVHNLVQAWRFDSGDEFQGSEIQCNPIIVDGVLYAATPRLRNRGAGCGYGQTAVGLRSLERASASPASSLTGD
jgi:hypothetical protein